ncbi:hypothetical protein NMY22_g6415 [Coprinellus aureogranulatus]|nr:hypothetical protein NMY22_g6415 [Coprinellus aureogranulatus]
MPQIPIKHKIRGGVSAMDASSDEETEVEFCSVLDTASGTVSRQYLQFSASTSALPNLPEIPSMSDVITSVAKAMLSEDEEEAGYVNEDVSSRSQPAGISTASSTEGDLAPNTDKGQSQYQGASVKMKEFMDRKDALQNAVFCSETHPDIGKPCSCGSTMDVRYTCRDCFLSPLRCKGCALRDHHHLIFHRISEWKDGYFSTISLKDLGLKVHLGHLGDRCPNLASSNVGRPFVLVHTNGMHNATVHFCKCDNAPEEYVQLTQAQLFPATTSQPETAFSFSVLNEFHTHTLTSKKSPYDYHDALRRLTDPAFPDAVPNRYRELLRASRVWRFLTSLRRSGQSHEIDEFLSNRRFPIGNVLLSSNASFRHKYTLFISADGNFRLQRKAKNDDPDDVALNEGNGYFANMEALRTLLSTEDEHDDAAICAHLRAVRLQNIVKFRNAVISGVISIQCARHGFHLPQGLVDLTKGEAYLCTDFALNSSLSDQTQQRWIMLSYDIWCSYSVKLKERFARLFPESVPLIENLRGAVPKMHIKNHIIACQQLWAFNYLRHSGETCGELIETSWAELNQASGSTKEMNDGHRHDTLDDFINFWNWKKIQDIVRSIVERYLKTLANLESRTREFDKFDAGFPEDLKEKWKQMPQDPYRDEKGKVHSVYQADIKDGPPTQASAYQKLVDEEAINRLANTVSGTGDSVLMDTGIELDERRLQLKQMAVDSNTDRRTLTEDRDRFYADVVTWIETYTTRYPQIEDNTELIDVNAPEEVLLPLPSNMSEPIRRSLGIESLVRAEYDLREGQAHDALSELRIAIKRYNYNLQWKKDHVVGQGPNTRAQQYLNTLANDRKHAGAKYRRVREAMLNLGLDPKDPILRPLSLGDDELKTKNAALPAQLGDSKKKDPWFWNTMRPGGMSKEERKEWSIEMDRVKWFRDRAARDRAREEKEILEEEMKRVTTSFKKYATIWSALATKSSTSEVPGKSSYALRQSAMYTRMAEKAEAAFTEAQGPRNAQPPKERKKRTERKERTGKKPEVPIKQKPAEAGGIHVRED